jgi:hypothetical protein
MTKIIPTLEVNGVTYELKRTAYLLAEYDRISEESTLSNEDKTASADIQLLLNDTRKYGKKMEELEAVYFETFDEEDERKYLKVKALYDEATKKLMRAEVESGGFAKLQREGIDALEKIAIKALAEQYFDMQPEPATKVWCSFVENKGHEHIVEWLYAMADCLFNDEEERTNDPFLAKVRAKSNNKKFVRTNR